MSRAFCFAERYRLAVGLQKSRSQRVVRLRTKRQKVSVYPQWLPASSATFVLARERT
jgi:hypothetical protein